MVDDTPTTHYALLEKNALWAMLGVFSFVLLYCEPGFGKPPPSAWACGPVAMAWRREPAAPPPFDETLTVRVQAVLTSDDDGKRQARATPAQFRRWINFANRAFRNEKIRFEFHPRSDWAELRNTVINNLTGTGDSNWRDSKKLGNQIAARYFGKLVVFVHHGLGPQASGGGFAWTDYDFIVMGGFADMNHCGHPHLDALAHEICHFLGLPHTFVGDPLQNIEAAEAKLAEGGNDPVVFDGDGFADTMPDPSIRPLECKRKAKVTLNGIRFRLPRENLMSYYDERGSLSEQQITRLRWVLHKRLAGRMALPKNYPDANVFEAEELRVLESRRCSASVQNMEGFGVGDWSNGVQIFCGTNRGGTITFELPVNNSQRYQLIVYATLAPDFGVIKCAFDSEPCGQAQDLYAPLVLPSGPLNLGTLDLAGGPHRVSFTVATVGPFSTPISIHRVGPFCTPITISLHPRSMVPRTPNTGAPRNHSQKTSHRKGYPSFPIQGRVWIEWVPSVPSLVPEGNPVGVGRNPIVYQIRYFPSFDSFFGNFARHSAALAS